jgi:hypothetical protein
VLQVRLFICDNPVRVVATFAEQVNGLTASRHLSAPVLDADSPRLGSAGGAFPAGLAQIR